ncbi:MAG: hypothetical protein IPN76_13640 [Saprospiraceae bacterium]|nr:hypothetical protein [Saprospiraceae bacterium]
MKIMKWLTAAALGLAVLFTACKKEESAAILPEQLTAAEDQTTANDLYEDVDDQVDDAIETRGGGPADCPTVTIVPLDGSYPRTMTIDFGTDGCTGPDGRVRKGQIVVNLTDSLSNAGAVRTATFVEFYVDDAHLEGTRTLTNTGLDANGNPTFTRTVVGGKITYPNGESSSWEANHTITLVEGAETHSLLDNVWEATGGATGVTRNGRAFITEITTPLVRKRICRWTVAGIKTLTVDGKALTIDYGDGTCDRKATVTGPNGNTREILIRWWR